MQQSETIPKIPAKTGPDHASCSWIEVARRNKRWGICILLMLSTTISYLDRQTLAIAEHELSTKFRLSPEQYGYINSSFLLAYAVMHPIAGRIIDWLGTRMGFSLAVIWWSIANISHALARGFGSLCGLRFLLGIGEAGNFPGAIKTVSEWFPPKERSMATGILNIGAGLGAMIAPPAVGLLIIYFGWQMAFVVTGSIGFLWVILWILFYYAPDTHPRITPEELTLIREGQVTQPKTGDAPHGAWRDTLLRKDLWVVMLARFLSDPVWVFYVVWLPKYLRDVRGFDLKQIAMFAWMPFLAGDIGSIVGGALSSFLARRGFQTINARKLAMCICAAMMPVAALAVRAQSPYAAIFFVSVATFAHQAWAASILTLPADLFPRHAVASAYGFTGACGNFGGCLFMPCVGLIVSHFSYVPVFIIVGFLHPVAALITVLFIRAKGREETA